MASGQPWAVKAWRKCWKWCQVRVGGDEDAAHQFAVMIIDRQEEGLLVRGGPPLVNGGIVLPEFAHLGALPAAAGPGGEAAR